MILKGVLLLFLLIGQHPASEQQIYHLQHRLSQDRKQVFLKDSTRTRLRHHAFRVSMRATHPCTDLMGRVFLYSSGFLNRHQTAQILQKRHLKPQDEGCYIQVFLPEFEVMNQELPALQFAWDQTGFDATRLELSWFRNRDWEMLSEGGVGLTDMHIEEIVLAEAAEVLSTLRQRHLAWPETIEGKVLFGLLALLPAALLVFRFYRSLRVRFLAVFVAPVLLLGLAFPYLSVNLSNQIEKSLLGNAREDLASILSQMQGAGEAAEATFIQRLKQFETQFPELIASMKRDGTDFSRTPKGPHPLTDKLNQISKDQGLHMMMFWSGGSVQADFLGHLPELRNRIGPAIHILMRMKADLSPDSPDPVSMRQGLGMLQTHLAQMKEVLGSTRDLDDFIYGPRRLFPFNPLRYGARPFRFNKTFWSFVRDNEDQFWYILGCYDEVQLVETLSRYFHQVDVSADSSTGFYIAEQSKDYPIQTHQPKLMELGALISMETGGNIFLPVQFEGQAGLAMASPMREVAQGTLVLVRDLKPLFQRRQSEVSQMGLYAILLLLLMLLAAYLTGQMLSRPLQDLTSGLQRIAKGDLRQDLKRRGQDELASVTEEFNRLLRSLREKELITRFLSVSARRNIEEQSQLSYRASTLIVFVGVPYDSPYPATHLSDTMIDTLVKHIQPMAISSSGFVDKFMGNAFLIVLENPVEPSVLNLLQGLKETLGNVRAKLVSQGAKDIRLSLGASLGEVVLGHVGARARKDFTCIGNPVNMAARLMHLKHPKELRCLVDARVYTLLADCGLNWVPGGSLQIKGKAQEQDVYELA